MTSIRLQGRFAHFAAMVLSSWRAADLIIQTAIPVKQLVPVIPRRRIKIQIILIQGKNPQDSEDEDDEFHKKEDEGEDEVSEDENGSASDWDASPLGSNQLFTGLNLYSLIPIYCIH